MHKRIAALLATIMLIFLAGCGVGTPNHDSETHFNVTNEMSPEEKFDAIAGKCNAFLQITINPAFELYLSWDDNIREMRVVSARPINEDAENLFHNLSVSDMTLYDALFAICNAAKDNGYLHANSNVEMAYYGLMQGYNVEEVIPLIMDEIRNENKISFTYNATFTEIASSATDTNTRLDTSEYDSVEYDANGNIVKAVIVESWGTKTQTFDANAKLTSEIIDDQANNLYSEKQYTDGVLVREYSRTPEQEHAKIFNENGNLISDIDKNQTIGLYTEYNYDDNGNTISEIVENQEKASRLEKHFTNGILTKEYHHNAEKEQTKTFDANGRITSEITHNTTNDSDTESYWTYYPDGAKASHITKGKDGYYTQGFYKEEQYYQSGAVSMTYEVSQYGDNKYFYDTNGKTTRYEGKNNLGERVEIVYNDDGSSVSKIYETGGKIRVETEKADGSLVVTYE